MQADELCERAVEALDDLKADDIRVLDVRERCYFTDYMIFASGNSPTHVKAMAQHVVEEAKRAGERPLGIEGEQPGDWLLVDLGDVVVHAMLPDTREFYQLEKFWSAPPLPESDADA